MNFTPTAADFAPAEKTRDVHGLSRPSLSYCEDAWLRLKKNRRAIASLWIVIGLLLFTVLGPFVWRVDSFEQNLDRISQPPNLGVEALLVERGARWDTPVDSTHPQGPSDAYLADPDRPELAAPQNLRVVGEPHTWGVRIQWDAVDNAAKYNIYRNTYEPTKPSELGLPLLDTLAGNEVGYQDALDLSAG